MEATEIAEKVSSGEISARTVVEQHIEIINEIESDVNGKLIRVLVENGDPVEYGQPLFVIDPS